MPKKSYPARSAKDTGLGLGAVIYEALLLAYSLQLYRETQLSKAMPDTNWHREHQIALELMVVKCRVLDDFLTAAGDDKDDMHALDFAYDALTLGYPKLVGAFRKAINKRAAHLTWTRVKAAPLDPWEKVSKGVEVHAVEVLKETFAFIEVTLKGGTALQTSTHDGYWKALQTVYPTLI